MGETVIGSKSEPLPIQQRRVGETGDRYISLFKSENLFRSVSHKNIIDLGQKLKWRTGISALWGLMITRDHNYGSSCLASESPQLPKAVRDDRVRRPHRVEEISRDDSHIGFK
jgi:hypothetical protein